MINTTISTNYDNIGFRVIINDTAKFDIVFMLNVLRLRAKTYIFHNTHMTKKSNVEQSILVDGKTNRMV